MATLASPQPAAKMAPHTVRPAVRPVVLLILDGFGCRADAPDNAITRARMPNWDRLLTTCPHRTIDASELRVGLPEGQMGNSEVGHMNIGAGRVLYQMLTRIDKAIQDGSFFRNAALVEAVEKAKAGGGSLHLLGLVSDGGVHSSQEHLHALLRLARDRGLEGDRVVL